MRFMRAMILAGTSYGLRTSIYQPLRTSIYHPPTTQTRLFAAPQKRLPSRRVDISCSSCGHKLFRYAKGNGASSRLVKVYKERIVKDFTEPGNPCVCPNPECGVAFCREDIIHGRPAFKIVQGKVVMK